MDLLNHIYRLVFGGNLHLSPIGPNPRRVLDIGTGTQLYHNILAAHDLGKHADPLYE